MPINAWICRGCGGRKVPLDHFATTECGESVCHPDYAAAVLADRTKQPSGKVRVTNGLGCPRRSAIEAAEDYAVDPLDLLPSVSGVAWHAWVEQGGSAETNEVAVSGTVDGVPVQGTVDRIRTLPSGECVIEDHKSMDTLTYYKEAKEEHVAQMSVYAHLYGRVTRGIIWAKTHKKMVPFSAELWPIEQVAAFKPYGGEYTVAELYAQSYEAVGGKPWKDLPLAGQSMRFGVKGMCDFCNVREDCTVAAMGSPWG